MFVNVYLTTEDKRVFLKKRDRSKYSDALGIPAF